VRIRTIKPEFFIHDGLYEAEREFKLPLRIAFAGLWCAADREGRFKWEPRRLGAQILPYDGVDFSRVLHALVTRGFLVQYRVDDACFGAIPSWHKHQIINNRERASDIPNPADGEQLDACPTRDPRVTHASKEEGKGREGKGRSVGEHNCAAVAAPHNDSDWFDELRKNPAYQSLNIDGEFAKMRAWCEVNKRQPSRRRFVNWLNRCERPMQPTANRAPEQPQIPEPAGWREYMQSEYPGCVFVDETSPRYAATWAQLPADYQKLVADKLNKRSAA